MYGLKIKSPSTIDKLVKKGMNIKKALIQKGIIEIFKDNNNNPNTSNDKNKFWSRNKNVPNDGVMDTRTINNV